MNEHLTINASGIKLMHEFEGCKLTAYQCPAKVWTIGYGCTFYEDGSPVKKGDKITQERAESLFKHVLKGFEKMAKKAITAPLTANQFSAFVSALYNIGPGNEKKSGLIKLKDGRPSTLLRLINDNPSQPAIAKAFLSWVSPGSAAEKGLRRRRTAELNLYFS